MERRVRYPEFKRVKEKIQSATRIIEGFRRQDRGYLEDVIQEIDELFTTGYDIPNINDEQSNKLLEIQARYKQALTRYYAKRK